MLYLTHLMTNGNHKPESKGIHLDFWRVSNYPATIAKINISVPKWLIPHKKQYMNIYFIYLIFQYKLYLYIQTHIYLYIFKLLETLVVITLLC